MKKLRDDINKNTFEKIYLLYGEEDYLRRAYKKALKEAIVGPEDSMNYNYFEGKSVDFSEVIGISETLPFFAEKRLVVIEDSGCFKSANEKMVEYISKLPETTYMIFVERDVDKRSKMYKQVKSIGYTCEMLPQNTAELTNWIMKMMAKDKKKISKDTIAFLLLAIGNEMENITKEVEKLLCYTIDKDTITNEDIEAICVPEISGKIFEMIDAMSNKNRDRLLKLYYELIESKEPPMRILFMVVRQFNIMLQVEELRKKGYGESAIADKLKLRSFIVTKVVRQLDNFKGKKIKGILNSCADIEEKVKTGRIDEKIGIELLLVSFSI